MKDQEEYEFFSNPREHKAFILGIILTSIIWLCAMLYSNMEKRLDWEGDAIKAGAAEYDDKGVFKWKK